MDTYNIKRMYQAPSKTGRIIERGLSLEQAQAHCRDPETSSRTCQYAAGRRRTERFGAWFDGYEKD